MTTVINICTIILMKENKHTANSKKKNQQQEKQKNIKMIPDVDMSN